MQGYGETKMKSIKNTVIALGLMAMSSSAFAMSTFLPGTEAGSSGSLTIVQGADPLRVTGGLGLGFPNESFAEGGTDLLYNYYELVVTGPSTDATVTAVADITTLSEDAGLWFSIFENNMAGILTNQVGITTGGGIAALLDIGTTYYLKLSGADGESYAVDISAVPVPAAGILFASALFGAGALSRRKKKATQTNMVDAFARAA